MKKLLFLLPWAAAILNATPPAFDSKIKNNSLAISPDGLYAAVTYSDSPQLVVYDLVQRRTAHVLDGFVTPRNLVFTSDGRLLASDSSLGEVLEITLSGFAITHRYPVGAGAFGTALGDRGNVLYVNNEAANTVTELDLRTRSTRAVLTGFAEPRQGIRVSADGTKCYVTNFASDAVVVFDTGTRKTTATINGFNQIRAISLTRDGKSLYAANSGSNEIAVVDLATHAIVQRIPVGRDPYGATLSPDEKFLLTASKLDGTLDVVDLAARRIVRSIPGFKEPRQALVYGADGNTVYVLNKDLSVSVVDLARGEITHTLTTAVR